MAADDRWQIRGALSEACACDVPCTCDFGQGPSPHNYCHAVYAYGIKEGNYSRWPLIDVSAGAVVSLLVIFLYDACDTLPPGQIVLLM